MASGSNEVFYRHSKNTAERFRRVSELSKTLSVDGGICAVFQDICYCKQCVRCVADKASGCNEIFLRESNDRGNKFSGIKELSKNNTADSITPVLRHQEKTYL